MNIFYFCRKGKTKKYLTFSDYTVLVMRVIRWRLSVCTSRQSSPSGILCEGMCPLLEARSALPVLQETIEKFTLIAIHHFSKATLMASINNLSMTRFNCFFRALALIMSACHARIIFALILAELKFKKHPRRTSSFHSFK